MKIDIFTIVIVLSITNLLQVIALFLQYRVNKAYKGVGWWLLGFTSMSSGYTFLFLRGIISVKMISIILANALILTGTVFLYIGIMRFFDKKENRGLILSIFSVYILLFIYYTYFNDYITSRTVIIYGIMAAVSFLIAWSIFFYKTVSVAASANFNTALFFTQGCFFSFRSIITLTVDPVDSLFTPAVMQEISFVFLFIMGILVTLGLIIMINQRLNSESNADKENLELFFNTNPDSVLITRLTDGFFVRVNEGFATLTGYTRKDVIDKSSLEINLWENPEDRLKVVSALRERGFCENFEVVFLRKDGSPFTGLISSKIINLQGVPHIISVTRDITDRKRIETALRKSELKYRSLIENTSDVVFCVNEKGEYQFVNNVFASTFGQKPEYFIGKTFRDVYPEEHADYRQEANRRVFETGESQSLEVTVPLPDRTMYYLAKANPIKDENGVVILNLTTATDITERKEFDKALHDSEEKFRLLIENSHDIIYTLTSEGIFTFVSNAWTELLGHPVNQVIGQSFVPFVHPDDVPVCTSWLKKVIETGERQDGVEYRVRHLNGTWCWHTSSAVPLRNEAGTVIGFEGTARDITRRKLVEDALKQSTQKLEAIISASPDGIGMVSLDGKLQLISDRLALMYGYTLEQKDELIGKVIIDFIDPSNHKLLKDHIHNLIDGRGKGRNDHRVVEYLAIKKDNTRFYAEVKYAVLSDSNGNPANILFVERDITDRKIAEDALKQTSARLSLAARAGGVGVWDLDLVNNTLLWDEQMLVLYGTNKDYFSGAYDAWLTGLHPDDKVQSDAEIQMALSGEKEFDTEFRVVWRDGSIHNIRALAIVQRDDSGLPVRMIGTNWDITRQKHAEEALRESEEKLNTLFSSMTEMVVLHDLVLDENGEAVDYLITDCNNAFTAITGIQKIDAVGKPATEVYHTVTAPFIEEYARVALTGDPYEYTTYFEPMDKHFSVSVVSPKKNAFATITTDITGIREIQNEIFAKNEELESYLYIASHDLRSPLVNIQGFSRRLQKHADSIKKIISDPSVSPGIKSDLDHIIDEDIPKSLNFIFSSVTKMETLLAGLLHLSRTGRTLMTIKRIDINQLFHMIISNYNFQLTEMNALVNISELPPCYGDENLLNQLFSNIIGNAIKYRDRNRQFILDITAHIEFRKVIYSIRDNGMGIDQRHLEKIWDIFYKVDASQPDAGDGLGLSIVKRIAEKHNGKVRVESEPGRGSVFFVELQRNEFTE